MALTYGVQMRVAASGGSLLADVEAAHLAQSIPQPFRLGAWACHEMLTVDVAPNHGPRNAGGRLRVGETPGLGVIPDKCILGAPIAIYTLSQRKNRACVASTPYIETPRPLSDFDDYDPSAPFREDEYAYAWERRDNGHVNSLS